MLVDRLLRCQKEEMGHAFSESQQAARRGGFARWEVVSPPSERQNEKQEVGSVVDPTCSGVYFSIFFFF